MKLGFYLATAKGLRVLQQLVPAVGPDSIAYVIGARDPQVLDDAYTEIAALCSSHAIPFFENAPPPGQAAADIVFAASWRLLIRGQSNLIVLHDSLLPKYRGFSPLPTALINGETTVGVTAFLASEEFDKGDIVGQRSLQVAYPAKIGDVIDRLAALYGDLVTSLCTQLLQGVALDRQVQNDADATYSVWRDEDDYRIGWRRDAAYIKRFIDAVGHPYKGASSILDGAKVRILDAEVEPDVHIEDRHPGKVLFLRQGTPVVICGQGLLKLTALCADETRASVLPLRRLRLRFR